MRLTIPVAPTLAWHALTDPCEVATWSGLRPIRLEPDYPVAGEHALWREHDGVVLHDEILAVDPERRLYSRLRRGPWLAVETYLLAPAGTHATTLRAEWRGHPALVLGNDAAMRRLVSRAGRAPA
jgi:uncharacterized protein YndB with AHSA1/START domain